jgi:hypothetical protein
MCKGATLSPNVNWTKDSCSRPRAASQTSSFSLTSSLCMGLGKGTGVNIGGVVFHIQLHCTRRDSLDAANAASKRPDSFLNFVVPGRCNISEAIARAEPGPATIAAACGPPSLALEVSETAWQMGCDFHAEQFAF